MMKTIVVITAFLLYENVPKTMQTDWPGKDFNSVYECREYIKWNKVNLTMSLFDRHLEGDHCDSKTHWDPKTSKSINTKKKYKHIIILA